MYTFRVRVWCVLHTAEYGLYGVLCAPVDGAVRASKPSRVAATITAIAIFVVPVDVRPKVSKSVSQSVSQSVSK